MDANPKLLVQARNKLCTNHYSYRTEQQYLAWIRKDRKSCRVVELQRIKKRPLNPGVELKDRSVVEYGRVAGNYRDIAGAL